MTAKMEAPAGGGNGGHDRSDAQTTGKAAQVDTTKRPFAEAAMAYARLDYVPVPLNADRKPILKGWPDAEAGEEAARDRFERCAAHGMALLTRGFIVIDLDRNHADGVDGIANFAALVAKYGDFPRHGPRVRSRRGGLHIYLALPEGL